jgi:hypothetical protein
MPALTHSPADVLRSLIVLLDQGEMPPSGPWPVYVSAEPDVPDDCITVYDTEGVDAGRDMYGEVVVRHGAQVRVRGADHRRAWAKADAVAASLDEAVFQTEVPLEDETYLVHTIRRASGPLRIGYDTPQGKRNVFTLNVLLTLRQL